MPSGLIWRQWPKTDKGFQVKIFYFDAHIGTHSELMYVLKKIYGDSVEIEGWLISGHSFLLGRQPDQTEIVDAETWRRINEAMIDSFWEKYKVYLNTFDLFVAAYPAVFSMLYAKTNKPILIYNCVRYDMPFCWSKDLHSLNQFNNYLSALHQEMRVSVISNNLADHDYFQAGPHGVPSVLIPTIGTYAKLQWRPTTANGLIYSGEDHLQIANPGLVSRKSLGVYSNEILCSFGYVVHMPYEVSTMSLFEQYAGGIPLYVPTLRYLLEEWEKNPRLLQSKYWLHNNSNSFPTYLKNQHDQGSNWWWLSRSDFYHHLDKVNYFDSTEELVDKVSQVGLLEHIRPLAADLERREKNLLALWQCCLNELLN